MSKNPATSIVDIGCQSTAVANYFFLGAAAGQTVAGFFVDAFGNRTGASFSLSLNQANGTNDALSLPSIPSDAIGAIARFTATTYVDFTTGTSDDFEDNYANYPQLGAADGNVFLGRVNA
jgi:hypothetical protein